MLDPDAVEMCQVQQGRLERFAILVGRHQSSMFRYAQSRLRDRPLAEDAVQEAFLSAFAGRNTFDPHRGFRPWLWTILLNTCQRLSKREARPDRRWATRNVDEPAAVGGDPQTDAMRADEQARFTRLLEQLPAEQAEAIRLRFFGELSFPEVGQTLGCTTPTAKSRVRYGLAKLAELLTERAGSVIPASRERKSGEPRA